MARKRIGDLLIERGLINENELNFALDLQKQTHEKLGEVLVKNRIVTPEDMARTLAYQLGVDFIDLRTAMIPQELSKLVLRNTARGNHLVPVQRQGDSLFVAMSDPLNFYAIDEVRKVTKLKIVPMIATEEAVEHTIAQLYGNEGANQAIRDYERERSEDSTQGDSVTTSNFDFIITANAIDRKSVV